MKQTEPVAAAGLARRQERASAAREMRGFYVSEVGTGARGSSDRRRRPAAGNIYGREYALPAVVGMLPPVSATYCNLFLSA